MQLAHILMTAVNAILPILLLILLGNILKRHNFVSEDFLRTCNKMVFKVFLPCMLFINVYDIQSFSVIPWDIVIYCVAMVIPIFLLGLLLAIVTTDKAERRGVIWQCAFRSNYAIIGLSLAAALGGDEALAVGAVVSAFAIPTFNVLAVISLSLFVEQTGDWKKTIKNVLINVAKNPLIIGVVSGLVCLAIRSLQVELFGEVVFAIKTQTKFLYTALNNLKSIASPLALVAMGGLFEFSAVKGLKKEIIVGTFSRIIMGPIIGVGCAVFLTKCTSLWACASHEFPALIALFGSPVAVSSAVMAGGMGNDEQLATQLVVWTSIGSIITIFLLVCILMATGMLVV